MDEKISLTHAYEIDNIVAMCMSDNTEELRNVFHNLHLSVQQEDRQRSKMKTLPIFIKTDNPRDPIEKPVVMPIIPPPPKGRTRPKIFSFEG